MTNKIALLGDTHFGARGDNKFFQDYFKKFYDEIFFPYLINNNIKTVLQLGDIFDRRKKLFYQSAKAYLKDRFIDCPIRRQGNLMYFSICLNDLTIQ